MRLLSFIADVERALKSGAAAGTSGRWRTQRMVDFQYGLARLTLTPESDSQSRVAGGVIFVQAFTLPDGSLCLKASLNWRGSDMLPIIAVYGTPHVNWRVEATRVASAWLEGPPAGEATATTETAVSPAAAVAATVA